MGTNFDKNAFFFVLQVVVLFFLVFQKNVMKLLGCKYVLKKKPSYHSAQAKDFFELSPLGRHLKLRFTEANLRPRNNTKTDFLYKSNHNGRGFLIKIENEVPPNPPEILNKRKLKGKYVREAE